MILARTWVIGVLSTAQSGYRKKKLRMEVFVFK